MNYFHLLTMVFVLAKLFDRFPYSWWVVLAPSLVSFGIGLAILAFVLVVAILKAVYE